MDQKIFVLGLISMLLGFWILFGSLVTFGNIQYEIRAVTLKEITDNFWAVKNFMISVMVPVAVVQIFTGVALMIIGSKH